MALFFAQLALTLADAQVRLRFGIKSHIFQNGFVLRSTCTNFAADYKRERKMELPKDPMMLYSTINMKLRDEYDSLDALCDDMDVERQQIEEQLATVGFEYNTEQNKFW